MILNILIGVQLLQRLFNSSIFLAYTCIAFMNNLSWDGLVSNEQTTFKRSGF